MGLSMKEKMKARMKNRRGGKKPSLPKDIKPGSEDEQDFLKGTATIRGLICLEHFVIIGTHHSLQAINGDPV